jgi:superfamily II DNA or RNA helicase
VEYHEWLAHREQVQPVESIRCGVLNEHLFPHQRSLVDWALGRGRAAIFADTGLGKTLMQTAWADVVAEQGRVLILAPLAVAEQTVREARRFGIECVYRREDKGDRITVANYEMLSRFNPRDFAGVVLDESSILKSFDGSNRTAIIEAFADTRFRLACTATPAPNDHTELGNHAEFLGVQSRVEMLAEYFVHDAAKTQDWRLKGHAREAFWRWVCSWAAVIRKPSDLGYSDEGFILPPLIEEEIRIPVEHSDAWNAGQLFASDARTLSDQRSMRKATMAARIAAIRESIAREPDDPALIWCELNAESSALAKAIPGAVEVVGSDTPEEKAKALLGFADGDVRVLVTKPSIAGFGLNLQRCARVYFVGVSHSYEQTYQAIRRCWRFGQTRPVIVRTCVADTEYDIVENVRRKHAEAEEMGAQMIEQVSKASYATGTGANQQRRSRSRHGSSRSRRSSDPREVRTVPRRLR